MSETAGALFVIVGARAERHLQGQERLPAQRIVELIAQGRTGLR